MSRIAIAALWLLHFLPLGALAALGNALGLLVFLAARRRRRVALVNLEKCFPHMTAAERARLARAHFRAVTRAFLEHAILWWAPRARIGRLVRLEGLEHLRALGSTPVIILVPHFVGLDAGATRLACEINAVSMYARQKDRHIDALLRHGRSRFGDQLLVSRQDGIRAVIRPVRDGRPLYYLPDMDYGRRGALFVPFFGVAAATMPGLARIAAATEAKVLPFVTRMLPGGAGYVASFESPWEDFPTQDVEADTRRMNAYIEQKVLEMPEQYYWVHRRFKTRPEGEAGFYA
ncbi:MAG TPA: lipid A biosynthesis acyltransferase [Burkholderiales bacterium]|nr:lipid A biosynthesis acyltransferase [Burkholderiales bacterium]